MQIEKKVGHWLSQQHDPSSGEHEQTLKLVKTWDLSHVNTRETMVNKGNSFSVSESGAIGISNYEKPSLSVVYPDTDKVPTILSHNGSIPALALVYVIMTRGQISHKLWRDTQFGMPLSSPTYCDSL